MEIGGKIGTVANIGRLLYLAIEKIGSISVAVPSRVECPIYREVNVANVLSRTVANTV